MRRSQIGKSETGATHPSLTSKEFDKVTHLACSIANPVIFILLLQQKGAVSKWLKQAMRGSAFVD